jgi:hypothetical protein
LKRRASELQVGDVIIDRSTRPLTVTTEPMATKYRGQHPGWRIKVSDGYPALVVKGDPEITIADDPEEAWNEYAKFRA